MKSVLVAYETVTLKSVSGLLMLCVLGLSLFGCPSPVAEPDEERDMAIEEDMMAFKFDLDLEDMEPVEEDMDPVEEDMMVVEEDRSCSSCQEDSDCGSGYLCVQFDEDGLDKRCFMPCEEEDEEERCGDGFSCLSLTDDLNICVADESSSCELCYDPDGDDYGPGGFCPDGDIDCDSTDRRVNPDRNDDCDGVDNDCDGSMDEDFEVSECGRGSCQAQSSCVDGVEEECIPPEILADDLTCDGQDDDCDGNIDEDFVASTCGLGLCLAETTCFEGAETVCEALTPSVTDDLLCDGIDDDCDGRVDESFTDSCGNGVCVRSAVCAAGIATCEPSQPDPLEQDVTCNNIDEDCDGNVDEGFVTIATCGLGACQVQQTCVDGAPFCEALEPSVDTDTTCDGIDDDCDGEIDEDCHVNTFRVEYNAEQSDAFSIALDIYYDQLYSPASDPTQFQPTSIQIAIAYPEGMSKQTTLPGSSLIEAEKLVSETFVQPPGAYEIYAYGDGAASAFPIPASAPADGDTPPKDGKLVTMIFNIGSATPPYNFTWDTTLTSTAPADPTMAQFEPAFDENGQPILDPVTGEQVETEVRRVLVLTAIPPINP